MAWFGQGKDTIEWEEFRNDMLFYKWPSKEIKKGATLIIRQGQKAIFYANGLVEGIFEEPGSYDIVSEIVPFLSTLKGVFSLRGDSGMRAEVCFINCKELLLQWGTRQRIMIPTPEVPSGIPIGCNGNLIIEFRDYNRFIYKVAGVRDSYSLEDISERIMGELNPIVAEAILGGQQSIGLNALIGLQQNSRKIGKAIKEELDKELLDFGLGVVDVNILSFNYPDEVQQMADRVAGQSFVGNVGKYAAIQMADGFDSPGGGNNIAAMGVQMAMGAQMAQQISAPAAGASIPAPSPAASHAAGASSPAPAPVQQRVSPAAGFVCTGCGLTSTTPSKFCLECGKPMVANIAEPSAVSDKFCTVCRKMVPGKFCPECGTQTV